MNAAEFLKQQASSYHFTCTEAWDTDYDLRPKNEDYEGGYNGALIPGASAADAIQLVACLESRRYDLDFQKDNSIHVHAPHRKEHSWFDRGWDCDIDLTVHGCEVFRKEKSKGGTT